MAGKFFRSDNPANIKLQTGIAKRSGLKVIQLSTAQVEDMLLGIKMAKEKTGRHTSKTRIFKYLDS